MPQQAQHQLFLSTSNNGFADKYSQQHTHMHCTVSADDHTSAVLIRIHRLIGLWNNPNACRPDLIVPIMYSSKTQGKLGPRTGQNVHKQSASGLYMKLLLIGQCGVYGVKGWGQILSKSRCWPYIQNFHSAWW